PDRWPGGIRKWSCVILRFRCRNGWAVSGLVVGKILKRIERVIDRGIAELAGAFLELVVGFDAVLVLHHVLAVAHCHSPSLAKPIGLGARQISSPLESSKPVKVGSWLSTVGWGRCGSSR